MKFKGLLFFYAFFLPPAWAAAKVPFCHEKFERQSDKSNYDLQVPATVTMNSRGHILANGVRVTGDSNFPLHRVREQLGLTDAILDSLPQDATVTSVGEGTGSLGPFLARRFAKTRFLDVWYNNADLPPEMAAYVAQYREHLITGTSTMIPLPDRSQNLVVSHRLINNFYANEWVQYKSLDEMVRILKPNGLALIEFTEINTGGKVERLVQLLKAKYGDSISIDIVRWPPIHDTNYNKNLIEDFRLVIRRHR